MSDEKQVQGDVQGMYAQVVGGAIHKMTVTMPHVSLTTYEEVNILGFDMHQVSKNFKRTAQLAGTAIDGDKFEQDFKDLLGLVIKTQKTTMHLISGDKICTYVAKTIVQREDDKFLEMSPYRAAWWMDNPHLSPIVESIQSYLPGFKPWKMKLDPYIRSLMMNSGLTPF